MFTLSTLILICLCSCSGDDDVAYNDIVGSWYGTRAYYNPVGGTKYQYLTVRFEANGSGELEYEAPTSFAVAYFTYSVKNDVITCKGAYASGDGDFDGDFELKLRIEGNRLIPLNQYNVFILTKDNSVMTDGDGNEMNDNSSLIYGVWLHSSGEVVLVITESGYTEYTLMSSSSNIYTKKTEGSFSINELQKYVLINGYKYYIILLSQSTLQLRSETNTLFTYSRGSNADIPSNGQGSGNYQALLECSKTGWGTSSGDRLIRFYDSTHVVYVEESSQKYGSWGYIWLDARGTYSLSGKTINGTFNDVSWQGGNSSAKDYFPGWTYGKTCYKTYTIDKIDTQCLQLLIDGTRYYLYNGDNR